MRQGAETQKREEAQTTAVLKSVEQQAAEQYARDQAAAEQELAAMHGTWEPDEGTGYLYNKAQRYYYDKATSMYYGGDPPTWTAEPAMPAAAKFGAEPPTAAGVTAASGELLSVGRDTQPLRNVDGAVAHGVWLIVVTPREGLMLTDPLQTPVSPACRSVANKLVVLLLPVQAPVDNHQRPRRHDSRDRRSASRWAATRCL